MSNDQSPASFLTTPLAIVIAGGFIALAVYLSNAGGAVTSAPSETTQPVAGVADNNPPAAAQPTVGDIRSVGKDDHVRGASKAKVTIIEYSDFECSFCKRFHPTMKQVVEAYPNDVQWVYRHFVLGMFPNSRGIAMATECAAEQGKFWEMADAVFEDTTTDKSATSGLVAIAQRAGVANINQFEECLTSEKYAQRIESDVADARVAGGRGTPYSVIIGPDGSKSPISGAQSFEQLKSTIDSLLQ